MLSLININTGVFGSLDSFGSFRIFGSFRTFVSFVSLSSFGSLKRDIGLYHWVSGTASVCK